MVFLQVPNTNIHEAADEFGRLDPSGFGMTIIAMGVVFSALIFLYLFFKNLSRVFTNEFKVPRILRRRKTETGEEHLEEEESTGDEIAAIAVALYFHSLALREMEDTVLTIKKVARNYSPWSSKIYGIRQNLR